jgi:hypothetical protein
VTNLTIFPSNILNSTKLNQLKGNLRKIVDNKFFSKNIVDNDISGNIHTAKVQKPTEIKKLLWHESIEMVQCIDCNKNIP